MVVRPKHFEQPLVLRSILVEVGELVAARAEGAGRRVHQRCDRAREVSRLVSIKSSVSRSDNAVAAGVDLADPVLVLCAQSESLRRRWR